MCGTSAGLLFVCEEQNRRFQISGYSFNMGLYLKLVEVLNVCLFSSVFIYLFMDCLTPLRLRLQTTSSKFTMIGNNELEAFGKNASVV